MSRGYHSWVGAHWAVCHFCAPLWGNSWPASGPGSPCEWSPCWRPSAQRLTHRIPQARMQACLLHIHHSVMLQSGTHFPTAGLRQAGSPGRFFEHQTQ